MNRTMNFHIIVLSAMISMFFTVAGVSHADSKSVSEGHKKVTGVVTVEKGGILTIKTPTGHLTQPASSKYRSDS